jgi:2-polyprenyl-3-methyl-5-hydroxy-6-metoxy-1,4-benzoquinol methylase
VDYRKRTFERYISTQLLAVNPTAVQRDFSKFEKYCRNNYLPLLPADRSTRILDVGCGMGRFLYFLQANGFNNALGIDTSAEAVERCRARGYAAEHDDALSHIGRHTDEYDAIVMNDIIEHLTKPELFDLMAGTVRALKPGGTVILKTPNAANPLMGAHSLAMDITHEIPFSEESLRQVLTVFDFQDVRVLPSIIYYNRRSPIHWLARAGAGTLDLFWRLLYALYGRPGTRIFTKHLLATGVRPAQIHPGEPE